MAEESRVDAHDRNKLDRMLQDLSAETDEHPALHAMFLVTREHEHAHDAFRMFRRVYEEAASPFHSLTIFGQHGASHAGRLLAQGLGVPDDEIPALALFGSHHDTKATLLPLAASVDGGLNDDLSTALERFLGEGGSIHAIHALHDLAGEQTIVRECVPEQGSIEGLLRHTMDSLTASLDAN